jgi:hypothetical protein
MCIYCGTNKYRKIYEHHYGSIPKDNEGRSYEVHHIDGNHKNNNPNNLKCLSIKEHYDIHYSQGDWSACLRMSYRMGIAPAEKSELASKAQRLLVEQGTHHCLYRISSDFTPKWRANISAAKKGKPTWNKGILRTEEEKAKMREGHSKREHIECPHCERTIDKPNYTRYHGDKCKSKN